MAESGHDYAVAVTWTGNTGPGTTAYDAYARDHEITAGAKPPIAGSADPAFRGDPRRYNPEELLVASLAACHMLWYLHLCAAAGIPVLAYRDRAVGRMQENAAGGGRFVEVLLRPEVTLAAGADDRRAEALHAEAHARCFVGASVNFPVRHAPATRVVAAGA